VKAFRHAASPVPTRDRSGRHRHLLLLAPTPVIQVAHRAGLEVHGWTFRRENQFLPLQFRRGPDPSAVGDLVGELRVFLEAGMDGFFTDNPDLGVAATA
jgi:glycerophosphoryl diester phosphodiesterase